MALIGTTGNDTLIGGTGNDQMAGGDGHDSMRGMAGNDTMSGGTGNDSLDGGTGNDAMSGGLGSDTYWVDSAGDMISETDSGLGDHVKSTYSYTLADKLENLTLLDGFGHLTGTGNSAANILTGNNGNNYLKGEGGNDSMAGGAGADTLFGGAGSDTSTGGTGADIYVYKNVSQSPGASGWDVITDFNGGEGDRIDLSTLDGNSLIAGDQHFNFIGTAAFTGAAGELRFDAASNMLLGNTDGKNGAEFAIKLTGVGTLDPASLILPPTFTSGTTATPVPENGPDNQLVYLATTDDPNATYALQVSGDSAYFSFNPATREVRLINGADYEDPDHGPLYTFTIVATDQEGLSRAHTVTLSITNLDEVPPVFFSDTLAGTIDENSGAGEDIYKAEAADPALDGGPTGPITYSLAAADLDTFSIDSTTGVVTLGEDADFEAPAGTYEFTVYATDGAGNKSDGHVVTLNVNNLDDADPYFTSGEDASVDENLDKSTVVYNANAKDDGDISGGFTFALEQSGDWALLKINEDNGKVRLKDSADFEDKSSYTFTVVVTDAAGRSDTQTVTLTVNDKNDAPTVFDDLDDQEATAGIGFNYTFGEDAFADEDAGDELSYTAALANGEDLPDWLEFDEETRTFSGVPGGEDVDTLTVRVTASDGEDSIFDDFIIDVSAGNGNTAPSVVSANDGASLTEDVDLNGEDELTATGLIEFDDVDETDTHTASSTGEDGYLGAFDAEVTAAANGEDIGAVTWNFSIANDDVQFLGEDETLVQTYTITIDDGNGGEDTQDVTVTVTGVNDAPMGEDDTNSVDEGEEATGSVASNDEDADDSAVLKYTPSDVADGLTLGEDGGYTLDATDPAYDHLGEDDTEEVTVSYTVTDEHGATGTAELTITVTGVNDAPEGGDDTNSGEEDSQITGSVADNDGDVDDGAVLSYALGDGEVSFFSVVVDDGLTMEPDGDYTLDASVDAYQHLGEGDSTQVIATYTVTDEHGATGTAELTITVSGVNDAAVITGDTGEDLTETDDALTASGDLDSADVDDSDGDSFQADTLTGTLHGGTLTINTAGGWSYTASSAHDEFNGGEEYTESFTVESDDGTEQVITINITGSADAAVITGDTGEDLTETDEVLTASGDLNAADPDSASSDSFQADTVTGAVHGGTLTIDTAGGWSYTASSAHDEFNGGEEYTESFTVESDDGTEQVITINITGSADAAVITGDTGEDLTETHDALTASGDLNADDADSDSSDSFKADTLTGGLGGQLTIDTLGGWSYDSKSAHNEFDHGEEFSETFTVESDDGTEQVITINITGINDAPDFTGDTSKDLTETNDVLTASGDLDAEDPDSASSDSFKADTLDSTLHGGTLTINTEGGWSYTASTAHDEFNGGEEYTETFTVESDDGSLQVVTINITGSADAAVITGDTGEDLTETDDVLTASGDLNAADPDSASSDSFQADTLTSTLHGGTLTINAAGGWSYTASSAHDEFEEGEDYFEIFTVESDDGTEQVITITIAGTAESENEPPTDVSFSNTTTLIAENSSTTLRTKVADIDITDDGQGTNTITLTGTDATSFEVEDEVLYLKAGVTLNYEVKSKYDVTVSVDDLDLVADPVTENFTLNLSDVNEFAPTVSAPAFSATGISFTANDADGTSALTFDSPYGTFGTVNKGSKTTLTVAEQEEMLQGELEVTDGTKSTPVLAYLVIGTSAGETIETAGSNPTGLYGFGGDDTFTGSTAADFMVGGAGNDAMTGNAGTDTFTVDEGTDTITDYAAGETLTVSSGATANLSFSAAFTATSTLSNEGVVNITSTAGAAITLTAATGPNGYNVATSTTGTTVNASTFSDSLLGNSGVDVLNGNSGADTIVGGTNADSLNGGAGADVFNLASGDFGSGEIIDGDADSDTIVLLGAGTTQFNTGTLTAIETLTGSAGDDVVSVGAAQWSAFTAFDLGASNDTLTVVVSGAVNISASGTPTTLGNIEVGDIIGAGGNDTLTAAGAQLNAILIGTGAAIALGNGTTDTITLTTTSSDLNGLADDKLTGVEVITVSGSNAVSVDLTNQSTEAFSVTGGGGTDTLVGGSSADILGGGTGAVADTLTGNGGNDTFNVTAGVDAITDLSGSDVLIISSGSTANATISGSGFTATSSTTNTGGTANLSSNGLTVNLSAVTGGTSGYNVTNSGAAATFTGSSKADSLTGGANGDSLVGQAGADILTGGDGNDTMTGGADADTFNANGGSDTVTDLGTGTDILVVSSGSVTATVTGNWSATSATSNAGTATLNTDSSTVNLTDATGANGWTVNSTAGIGAIAITGSTKADTMTSNAGSDTITGGVGPDTMTGGNNVDTFALAAGHAVLSIGGSLSAGTITGYDQITLNDFVTGGGDKLDWTSANSAIVSSSFSDNVDSTLQVDGATVKSHSVASGGRISFDDAASYSTALVLDSMADVAAVVQYLQLQDIGGAGDSVTFIATISSVTHTFVFFQGVANGTDASDVLVDLIGTNATAGLSTGTTGAVVTIVL